MCRRLINLKLIILFGTTLISSELFVMHGQDLEPRAYTNIPVGLNFLLAGYAYTAGGVYLTRPFRLIMQILRYMER
jgi:hypothetical protein